MPKRWDRHQKRWANKPRPIKLLPGVIEECRALWDASEYRNVIPGQLLGDGREEIVTTMFSAVPNYSPNMLGPICLSIGVRVRWRLAKGERDPDE